MTTTTDMGDVTETNEAGGVVTVDRGPIGGVAVSGDGRRLLVTNYGDDSVSVIDTVSGDVLHTVFGVDEPFAIAAGGRGRAYAAAASAAFDSILVLDIATAEVVADYPVALNIADLVADPTGHRVYVTRTGPAGVDVLIVDANRGPTGTVAVSTDPGATAGCIRISPDGRNLYVAVHRPGGDSVAVIGPDLKVFDTIEVGSAVRDVAVSPDGATIFIAGCDSDRGTVHVVDACTRMITDRFEVAASVSQLLLSCDGDQAYLLTSDGLAVVDTRTHHVLDTIAVGGSPSCAVQSPDGTHLFIAGHAGTVVAVQVAAGSAGVSLPDSFVLDDIVSRLLDLEPAV